MTPDPDLCTKRGREQEAPLGNHSKGFVNAELQKSSHVIFAALLQGNACFSSMSAPFEAQKAASEGEFMSSRAQSSGNCTTLLGVCWAC